MSNTAQYTVSIIQLCLPHYREPFFAELAKRLSGRLVLVAGSYGFGRSPVSVSKGKEIHFIKTRNIFIGNQLVIQHPLPPSVFSSSIAVLNFNPRILSNFWILVRRKQVGRPVIFWGHGLSARPDSPRWVKGIRKWMAQLADAVIFYNDRGKCNFINLGLPQEKLFVAHNAIDVQRIRQLIDEYSAKRQHILFVGRLIPAKKVDLLLEGFSKALDGLPAETRLIVIGDGPERAKLLAQAREAGILMRVEFAGEVTDEELLMPYFAQSMLAVSPGYVGLFAIQSLAYGVPMLIADAEPHSPEVEVLIQGQNCEFFSAGAPDALAEKLRMLFAQPEKLFSMGQAGIEDVTAKYSLQHMSNMFLQAFDHVLV